MNHEQEIDFAANNIFQGESEVNRLQPQDPVPFLCPIAIKYVGSIEEGVIGSDRAGDDHLSRRQNGQRFQREGRQYLRPYTHRNKYQCDGKGAYVEVDAIAKVPSVVFW